MDKNKYDFSSIVENAPDMIARFDTELRHIYCNKTVERQLGRPLESIIGKKPTETGGPPEQARFVEESLLRVLQTRKELEVDQPYPAPSGMRYYHTKIVPEFNKSGEIESLLAITRDVTDFKKIEFTLRERMKELNCLYGYSELMRDPEKSLDEILGSAVVLLPPAMQHHEIACAEITLDGKNYRTTNFRETEWHFSTPVIVHGIKRGAIEVFYLDKRQNEDVGPFIKEERNLINALAERLGKTIERKQDENALNESREKYQDLVENINDIIFTLSPEGIITYMNRAIYDIGGYTPEEVTGISFTDFIYPDDLENLHKNFLETMQNNVQLHEFRIVSKNGNIKFVRSLSRPKYKNNQLSEISGVLVDLTDHKLSEKALRESEEKYRTVADFTYDWEYWAGPDGRLLYVSPSCERITGFTPEEFINNPELMTDIVHPDDRGHMNIHLQKGMICGIDAEQSGIDFRIIRKDGSIIWIAHRCLPVFDDRGCQIGQRASNRDITGRILTEQALVESEDKFSKAFYNNPVPLSISNIADGRYVEVNDRFCEVTGFNREEVIDHTSIELGLMKNNDRDIILKRFSTDGSLSNLEFIFSRKDGTPLNSIWNAEMITFGGEKKLLSFVLDITERKQAEEELRLHSEILKNINEGIYIIGADDAIIKYTNPRFEKMFGYEPGEMLGKHVSIVNAPTDINPQEKADEIMAFIAEHGCWEGEINNIKKDGTPFWCHANVTVIDHISYGKVLLTVHFDITARKHAEEKLRYEQSRAQYYLDTVEAIIVALDKEGRITLINRKGCQIIGKDADKLTGSFWFSTCLPQPDGIDNVYPHFLKIISGDIESLEYFENSVVNRKGENRQIAWHNTLTRDNNGRITGTISSGEDITERKSMEKSIFELNERLQLAQTASGAGYWDWDIASDSAVWAPKLFDLYGLDPHSAESSFETWLKIIHPEDQESAGSSISLALKNHSDLVSEYRVILPDGGIRWLNSLGRAIYDSNGAPVRMTGLCIDITERKLSEERQIKLQKKLESLWGLARRQDESYITLAGYVLSEIESITDSQYGFYGFINADESIMTIYAWSPEAMKDCTITDKPLEFPLDKAGIWADAVRKRKTVLINNYNTGFEGKLGLPAGHVPITRLISIPVFTGDKITAIAAVANKNTDYTDDDIDQLTNFLYNVKIITERKRAEEEIKRSLREKESMLREIHHRVKNNFQIVMSLLNLQKSKIKDPAQQEIFMDPIHRIKVMAMIHERIYQSKDLATIEFSEFVTLLISELYQAYTRSHHKINVDIKAESVNIDISQAIPCGLIINELFSNSLKHAFPPAFRGTGEISISIKNRESTVELSISDNGVGLPPELKIDKLNTLGLNLVPSFVDQLKGTLRMDHKKGTCFVIEFPLNIQ